MKVTRNVIPGTIQLCFCRVVFSHSLELNYTKIIPNVKANVIDLAIQS